MAVISIIVPVYKVEAYLHRCVDSILNQSYSDFELILVDDGSPDNCGAICEEYASKDGRVHVIHQKNGGLSAARNAGIDWAFANSDSQWITFIDSDDWIHRDYLKILMHAGADICMCGFVCTAEVFPEEPVKNESFQYMDPQQAYRLFYGMCMTACCKLYRKALFSTLRFPVGKLHEDCYITHLPLFASEKVAVCNASLYYYYTNPNSITRTKWSEKRLEEIEAHELRLAWLQKRGYEMAARRELEAYVLTIYEHTEALARLVQMDRTHRQMLKSLRWKLHDELTSAREKGLYKFEREYLWMYLMAYYPIWVWYTGQWLRERRSRFCHR